MTQSPDDLPRAGQEAARLLAAAQDWLRTSAPHLAPVDDEGQTCPCPLCRAVAGVREADPDAVGRWVDSAVAAATAVLAQAGERVAASASPADDDSADGPEGADEPGCAEDSGADDSPAAEPGDGRSDEGRGVRRIPLVEGEDA